MSGATTWHLIWPFARSSSTGADVVLLSEVTPELASQIARSAIAYPHAVFCRSSSPCTQLLLSKIPLGKTGALAGDASTGQRSCGPTLAGDGPAAGITVVTTHIFRPTRGWARHSRQRDGLIAALGQFEGPLIVGGDLNVTGSSRRSRSLTQTRPADGGGAACRPGRPIR